MSNIKQNKANKKIMTTSVLLSAPGPIVTGIPAFTSFSSTQIADFIRRTAELVPLIVSLVIYSKLEKNPEASEEERNRLQSIANKTVVWSMLISAIVMFILGILRLFLYSSNGKVGMGLVIAVLGLITNSWFWLKYKKIIQGNYDLIIEGQYKIYRAKSAIDLCVVVALSSVAIFPTASFTKYVDAFGCIIVSVYLFYSALENKNK